MPVSIVYYLMPLVIELHFTTNAAKEEGADHKRDGNAKLGLLPVLFYQPGQPGYLLRDSERG
jgi:hypothetical protein